MNKKDNKLKIENNLLKKKNKDLTKELQFYKKIFEHRNSCIFNLRIKTINGEKVWIDSINIYNKTDLLFKLDKDEEVEQWIKDLNRPYKDNDW